MTAKVVEALGTPETPHSDLKRLFADESFRALHRGWSKQWPVVAPDS